MGTATARKMDVTFDRLALVNACEMERDDTLFLQSIKQSAIIIAQTKSQPFALHCPLIETLEHSFNARA